MHYFIQSFKHSLFRCFTAWLFYSLTFVCLLAFLLAFCFFVQLCVCWFVLHSNLPHVRTQIMHSNAHICAHTCSILSFADGHIVVLRIMVSECLRPCESSACRQGKIWVFHRKRLLSKKISKRISCVVVGHWQALARRLRFMSRWSFEAGGMPDL